MSAQSSRLRVHGLLMRSWLLAAGMAIGGQAFGQASADSGEVQRLIKDGRPADALKLIDDALAKNPKDPNMRFRRGVALSMLDRKSEALTVFQKLVEDHPDMPAPYNNLAVLYGAQGDYDKARSALERAIRTNPAYATAYQNLGDVYAQLASQAYAKALQLDKNDTTVPPKLALLRELTSTPAGATPAATAVAAAPPASRPTVVAAAPPPPAPKPAPAPQAVASSPAAAPPAPTVAAKPPAPAPAPTVVAAAPPAPAPAPSPAPAPAASPSAPKPEAGAEGKARPERPAPPAAVGEVESAVRAWASAWARQDMAGYFASYTPDFKGQQPSRKAWEQERRERIEPRKRIKVELSQIQVNVNGDRAQVRFRQNYASDALDATSRKTLELVRGAGGKWQIRSESVGG